MISGSLPLTTRTIAARISVLPRTTQRVTIPFIKLYLVPALRRVVGLNKFVFTIALAYTRASDRSAESTSPRDVSSRTWANGMLARLLQLTKVAC